MPGQSPLSMMQPPEQRAQRQVRAPAPRRRRRWPIWAPVAAVILLAVLWSGLWYVSASMADRTLAGWVEREAAAGRVYSCGSETIGGFPLSIRADCIDATAEIKNSQPPYGSAPRPSISSRRSITRPGSSAMSTGPLNFAAIGQPPSLTADWTHARIIVSGVPPDPEQRLHRRSTPRTSIAWRRR